MTFRRGARIDTGRVGMGGGGRGPKLAMGGAGGLVVVVLALVFGVDPSTFGGGEPGSSAEPTMQDCETGEDANSRVDCRIAATAMSLDDVWTRVLPAAGVHYTRPEVTLFSGNVSTGGCGSATSDVGPFYCPGDATAYFDTGFFHLLENRFGASGGPLAQEYVVAHEFGHHIQNLLGDSDRGSYDQPGAASDAVRSELQADCYAGLWTHFADTTPAPGSDQPLLDPLTEEDLADALSAAGAVGDDHLQRQSGTKIDSDTWTHGSSDQRRQWFMTGYRSGRVDACETFAAPVGR